MGSVKYSPDGKWLASWGRGGAVKVSDVATGKTLLETTSHADWILAVDFDDDGIIVADAQTTTGNVVHWRVERPRKEPLFKISERSNYLGAAFSPDGTMLATAGYDGTVRLRSTATGKEELRLAGPTSTSAVLSFAPDGRTLAVGRSRTLSLWNLPTGEEFRFHDAKSQDVFSLAFSPDGKTLVSGSYYEGIVRLWGVETRKELHRFPKEFGVRTVAVTPDGKILAYGGEAGVIHLCDVKKRKEVSQLRAEYNIFTIAFSPDGKTVAASAGLFRQRKTRLWDIAAGGELLTFPRHEQRIDSVTFSTDGETVVTSSVDQTIRVWDSATGEHLFQIGDNRPTDERLRAPPCALSKDGKFLVCASNDTIRFWNLKLGKEMRQFKSLEGNVLSLAVSPDDTTLATLSVERKLAEEATDVLFHNNSVHLRDIETGKLLVAIAGLSRTTRSLGFSPNGRLLAVSAFHGKGIVLYDVKTGDPVRTIEAAFSYNIPRFSFSPNGTLLAVATTDNRKIRLWKVSTGKPIRTIEKPANSFESLAFSPNGKVLAAVGCDKRCLFEVASGRILWHNPGYEGPIRAVAFSPDGKRLVTAGDDGSALIWKLTPGQIDP
jgi:WD40 repeat protein